jgi:membrane protease YdiL (CAAX protease family)
MDGHEDAYEPTPGQPLADEGLAPAPEPLLEAPMPQQPSLARRIFFGPFGLRAGWSLLIYFSIVAAILFGVRGAMQHKAKHDKAVAAAAAKASPKAATTAPAKPRGSEPGPLSGMVIGEAVTFLVFFLISWLMAAIERRKLSAFGLGGSRFFSRFLVGAFWGLIAQSAVIALLYFRHLLVFDARLDHGLGILGWGAAQLFAFFLVGLVEEYMFRGYLQFTLTRGMVALGNLISPERSRTIAFWIAAVLTSALFYFAHTRNPGENKIGLFQVFLAGILLLVALWRTGSLWWAIGFHTTWDWAQSFLYGVPDSGGLVQGRLFATHAVGNPHWSGGTAGPEGSIFGIPVMLVVIVLLCFVRPSPQPPLETKYVPRPDLETGNSQLEAEF